MTLSGGVLFASWKLLQFPWAADLFGCRPNFYRPSGQHYINQDIEKRYIYTELNLARKWYVFLNGSYPSRSSDVIIRASGDGISISTAVMSWRTNLSPFTKDCREFDSIQCDFLNFCAASCRNNTSTKTSFGIMHLLLWFENRYFPKGSRPSQSSDITILTMWWFEGLTYLASAGPRSSRWLSIGWAGHCTLTSVTPMDATML